MNLFTPAELRAGLLTISLGLAALAVSSALDANAGVAMIAVIVAVSIGGLFVARAIEEG